MPTFSMGTPTNLLEDYSIAKFWVGLCGVLCSFRAFGPRFLEFYFLKKVENTLGAFMISKRSDSYDAYLESNKSKPSAGCVYPAGKPDTEVDSLGKPLSYEEESVKDAQDEPKGTAVKCTKAQSGGKDNGSWANMPRSTVFPSADQK